ncbi:hypothetical protein FQN54_002109 [Arachnomyces sp. PD_36]|nr:hypothetical protein FQN54_002109 [Arachnomyces sp. PD_36]
MPAHLSSKLFTLGAMALGSMALDSVAGWDTYRTYDLSLLRPNETTSQFSSFDRNGGNDDGFEGTHSCLRPIEETGRCIIADYTGAGEVGSVWFTYESDSIEPAGDFQVILDGVTVLEGQLQDIVDGVEGAPFSWPLVGNTGDTRGGNVIKIPMPFKESMLISTKNNPHFYHVTYRRFPSAEGVKTFDPSEDGTDVLANMKRYGSIDPKPVPDAPINETSANGSLTAGVSMDAIKIEGSGQITQIDIHVPQVARAPHVHDDGRAFGADGGSCMKFTVDPKAEAVRIVRRVDMSVGNQVTTATLDGEKIPDWESGPETLETWVDQVAEANVTVGTSTVKLCNTFGSSDLDINEFFYTVHSQVDKQWVLTDRLDVGPMNLNDELAHEYTITDQTWEGHRWFHYPIPVEEANAALDITNNLYLTFTFDGHQTARAPLASFFATGLGKFDVRSLMVSVDATENGAFTSWWPMPFGKSALLTIENESGEDITDITVRATYTEDESIAKDVQPGGARGYFSTGFNRGEAVLGAPWEFLKWTGGRGIVYGVSQAFRGYVIGQPQSLGYLEGDEMAWVNGETESTYLGTGTEDFYESAWYFAFPGSAVAGVPYYMPLAGMVAHEAQELDCEGECVSAYRWFVNDPIPFDNGINFQIEHGSNNDVNAFYDTVTYFYGAIDE